MKLIAVDLDGTLLGGTTGKYGFMAAGVEALRQAVSNQVQIGIATGRDMPFILELLKREGIVPADEGWPHVIVSEERFIHYIDENGHYTPDHKWNEAAEQAERAHFRTIVPGVSAMLMGELSRIDAASRRVAGDKEEIRGFVEVLFSNADTARLGEAAIAEWLLQSNLPYCAVRNVAGIAIRHTTVGKGPVLLEACRTLRIDPAEALVIGDSCNDLSMLDGGFGFAAVPANADDEVKTRVRPNGGYIATGSYGEGVAEAVYHFVRPI